MSTARRVLTITLAVLAAVGFALAVEGGRWWSLGADVQIGPVGSQHCFGGGCKPSGLAWMGGSALWDRLGFATYVGGLLAALVLVAMAGGLAARRPARLTSLIAAVATATATVVGGAFIALRPTGLAGVAVDRGVVLFVAAVVLAAAAIVSARLTPQASA
ncbi:MAG: hypothetical protein R3B06_06870 [Kofleriaceae bacterium]